jgi:hypothetical protein
MYCFGSSYSFSPCLSPGAAIPLCSSPPNGQPEPQGEPFPDEDTPRSTPQPQSPADAEPVATQNQDDDAEDLALADPADPLFASALTPSASTQHPRTSSSPPSTHGANERITRPARAPKAGAARKAKTTRKRRTPNVAPEMLKRRAAAATKARRATRADREANPPPPLPEGDAKIPRPKGHHGRSGCHYGYALHLTSGQWSAVTVIRFTSVHSLIY